MMADGSGYCLGETGKHGEEGLLSKGVMSDEMKEGRLFFTIAHFLIMLIPDSECCSS